MISLNIPGNPIAKKRPRFARRGKFVTTYNDQETEEGKFIAQVLDQIKGHKVFTGPLSVEMAFYKSRPICHYGTGKNSERLKYSAPKWVITKPDIDNYEKFVFDCLNGIAWQDDSQVVSVNSIKAYSETPMTIIRIVEV